MPAIEEPPVTTSSLPVKPSFLASDDFNKSLEEALRKDGKTEGFAPSPEKPPETKPAETKPVETKPVDQPPVVKDEDEVPADIKSPETQNSWKKLKGAMKAIESERDKFKTELEQLRKQAPPTVRPLEQEPEYQALKKAHDERNKELEAYSERLRLLDVEKHPKFQAYFKEKFDQQMTLAKEIGGDKLIQALQLPPGDYRKEQLREVASELDPLDQATLGSVLTNLRAIDAERASEIAKARQSYEQIQAQQQAQSAQEREAITKTFERVRSEVTDKDKGLAVYRERNDDPEWNKGVQERMAVAEYAFQGKLSAEDTARNAYWGAAAPQLLTELNTTLKRVADLEKQITDLRAVNPNAGGDRPGDSKAPDNTRRGLDGLMDELAKVMPTGR